MQTQRERSDPTFQTDPWHWQQFYDALYDFDCQEVPLQAWAEIAVLAEAFIVFRVFSFEWCIFYLVQELYTHGAWRFSGQCDGDARGA